MLLSLPLSARKNIVLWLESYRDRGLGVKQSAISYFDDGNSYPTPRYDRSQLFGGHVISGPAVVVQHNSTILIPPDYTANVGQFGNLTIESRLSH